jgi:hypothetical protein
MLNDKEATRLVKTLVHGICPHESAPSRRGITGDGKAKASRKVPVQTRSPSAGSPGSSRR